MKIDSNTLVLSVFISFFITGCQVLSAGSDAPALIAEPTDASRAGLRGTLSELFGGQEIVIADDALTQSSMLILQQTLQHKLDNQPALGRIVTEPFRFQLIKNEDECFLVDFRDGKRYLLADTTCISE